MLVLIHASNQDVIHAITTGVNRPLLSRVVALAREKGSLRQSSTVPSLGFLYLSTTGRTLRQVLRCPETSLRDDWQLTTGENNSNVE